MNEIGIFQLFIGLVLVVNTDTKKITTKFLPYFRKQAEEIEDLNFGDTTDKDDAHIKFVSIMINNPKEVFNDELENPEAESQKDIHLRHFDLNKELATMTMPIRTSSITPSPTSLQNVFDTVTNNTVPISSTSPMMPLVSENVVYNNMTISQYPTNEPYLMTRPYDYSPNVLKPRTLNSPNYMIEQVTQIITNNILESSQEQTSAYIHLNNTEEPTFDRRTCIRCNNLDSELCIRPESRADSIQCRNKDDICYTMNTPFGIVDRGCINLKKNISTYVCSCNLCNSLPISDMPHVFESKQDWFDNVVTIGHHRNLRLSVFKGMSCLRCEVNSTEEHDTTKLFQNNNCLNGNVTAINAEPCDDNEVCAVKAQKDIGYIWRGCVKAPLYNYWWTYCNEDFCNHEPLISLYDFV